MRVLLVEDDPRLVRLLVAGLEEAHFQVVVATTGREALRVLAEGSCEACILDINLPDIDGFAVLGEARAQRIGVPILMLTARDGVPDRVRGLNLGADDYLIKPFAFSELLARLHALLRRGLPQRNGKLRVGEIELDTLTHQILRAGRPIEVSPKQFLILGIPHAARRYRGRSRKRCCSTSGVIRSIPVPTSSTCTSGSSACGSIAWASRRSFRPSAAWVIA